MFEQIDIYDEDEKGSIEGYKVSSDQEQVVNWFSKRFHQKPDLEKDINVAFLNNLYIDEDSRGEGKGTLLLNSFIEECSDCHFIFLECDNGEHNNFLLSDWYRIFGFEIIYNDQNPIMVLKKLTKKASYEASFLEGTLLKIMVLSFLSTLCNEEYP